MKNYECFIYHGDDYSTFEFNSIHRAKSKGNLEDAKRQYSRTYGTTAYHCAEWNTARILLKNGEV